jgi:two-component system, OmpR family, phosphate regulon sensor histidine kinase PhoR
VTLLLIAVIVAVAATLAAVHRRMRRAEAEARALAAARDELAARAEESDAERAVLLQIMDGLGEGLLAIDAEWRVVLANRRFAEMTGISTAGTSRQPAVATGFSLSHVLRVGGVFDAFEAALGGSEARERVTIRTGIAERRVEIRAFPLASERIAAVGIFIDLTHIERLEQIRTNFISDFSHEVRTPLAALSAAVESFEIAADRLTAEDDHQLRRVMGRQLRRLQRLVDDLSELSRIESGDLGLVLTSVDLKPLLADLCEDFAERAAHKGLRLQLRGDDVSVRADALRIQQAFGNLIDNAIKYGGEQSTIEIDVAANGTAAVVSVTDHGEGVPLEEKSRIFHRFYRLDKSRSQDVAGTGLGLAITKHLVLLHRGMIDVESTPGEGATFIVTLPLA